MIRNGFSLYIVYFSKIYYNNLYAVIIITIL